MNIALSLSFLIKYRQKVLFWELNKVIHAKQSAYRLARGERGRISHYELHYCHHHAVVQLACQTVGNKNEHPSNFKELTVSLVFTDTETNNHVAKISIWPPVPIFLNSLYSKRYRTWLTLNQTMNWSKTFFTQHQTSVKFSYKFFLKASSLFCILNSPELLCLFVFFSWICITRKKTKSCGNPKKLILLIHIKTLEVRLEDSGPLLPWVHILNAIKPGLLLQIWHEWPTLLALRIVNHVSEWIIH